MSRLTPSPVSDTLPRLVLAAAAAAALLLSLGSLSNTPTFNIFFLLKFLILLVSFSYRSIDRLSLPSDGISFVTRSSGGNIIVRLDKQKMLFENVLKFL